MPVSDDRTFDDRGSPWWWLRELEKELEDRRERIVRFQDYYEGKHPLAFASKRFREAFGGLFKDFADNWCELVVDVVEERLDVEGFRVPAGENDAGSPSTGDAEAWAIWQRNNLDAASKQGHTEALVNGLVYALVWPDAAGQAEIFIEHPNELILRRRSGARDTLAALKKWIGDDGHEWATLYLPDGVYKFRSDKAASELKGGTPDPRRFQVREVDGEDWPIENKLGVVPIVPIVNRPRLLAADGHSEIAKVIPQQNAINKLVVDMIVASEFGAFRQRWATGMDIPEDPETGEPLEPFKAAIDRLWIAEDAETSFGEFGETNLANFVAAIENRIQAVASQTRTPPHYFYLAGQQFPSGEALKSAEAGLVAKVRDRMVHFGEAWEAVIRLAFLIEGNERARAFDLETIWGDPESRTEGEHVDATLKLQALGIPTEALWEYAGFSPQQIQRFKKLAAAQALESDALVLGSLGRFNADMPAAPAANGNGAVDAGAA